MSDHFDFFAGIDWASESHQVCLEDAAGTILGERAFAHSGAGLADLCDWLLSIGGAAAEAIAVSIEMPHGAVIDTLLERGFAVFALNPKQLDRFRDRLANRVREQLRRYYPQMLDITGDIAADWFLELWHLAPTPDKARRVHRATVERLLKAKRIRKIDADTALDILRRKPLTVAPGTIEAATAHIRAAAQRLRLVNRQIKEADKRVDALCARIAEQGDPASGRIVEQRDVEILRSLPGVGRIVLATLLAEASRLLHDRDYHALRALCGVAPVTKRSGKQCYVIRRLACHQRLRDATYHWARVAVQHDPTSKERYAALRSRGHSHARALRTVADRLLAVACAMLKTQTLFNPNHRQTTLKAA